jgi:VanZ family protein
LNWRRLRGSRLLRALFWAVALFVFVLAVAPVPQVPGQPSDKVQHMAAFAVLAVLGATAYPKTSAPALLLGLALFGAAIEIAQAVPIIHRDSDPVDWAADMVAAGLVLLTVYWVRRSEGGS